MMVTELSPHQCKHEGLSYYFCSAKCQAKFAENPLRYLSSAMPDDAVPAPVGTLYTCPMHPEVQQANPGSCPKCGMSLEPIIPLDEDDHQELKDFQRRFWMTLPLTVIVTLLAMFGHRFGGVDMQVQTWIELILSLPVVLWAGWPFFVRGWQSVTHRSPNMWTLISVGTGAAFVYSLVATVAPGVFPESFISMGRVGVY
jgi:Cu+-exporting ATPase